MRPRIIGTAGHVDHGKTSLIRALTGIDADRLPEEKERGMTIDLGFAYLDLPQVGRVSIVDVPGHERFLSNMLAGALGVELAILCVAADEGVKPQTIEHAQILDLLPVHGIVVALTRSDRADEAQIEAARFAVTELLSSTRFAGCPLIETSTATGSGFDELRSSLDSALQSFEPGKSGTWYLPIDRVFVAKGHGTVVTGTLCRGEVAPGAEAILMPGSVRVRVRALQSHGETLDSAAACCRLGLNLAGVEAEQLERGQIVGAQNVVFESRVFDARVRFVGEAKHGMVVRVAVGTAEESGKMFLSEVEPELVQIRLDKPIAIVEGQAVIIRALSTLELIAGGLVTNPVARARRKGQPVTPAGQTVDEQILMLIASKPFGMTSEAICREMGQSAQQLGGVFETLLKEKKAVSFAGTWVTTASALETLKQALIALQELHAKEPKTPWQRPETVAEKVGIPWRGKVLDRLFARAALMGKVVVAEGGVRLTGFTVQLADRQSQLLARVLEALEVEKVNVPGVREIAEKLRIPSQAVEEILKLGEVAGQTVRVTPEIYYTKRQMAAIISAAQELGGKGPFSAAQFKEHLQTSRKYAIPLLEYLDSIKVTHRRDDLRVTEPNR
ncbi:MAG: selenocysteine-specific translation elongation factor [Armatimonadetes bacterium]|nr:selenocysteine-specific translation elongation factor [Armatimonadota bacterium]